MVWLMRCGSDTESSLLLLISTEARGREGSRAAGLKTSERKWKDDGLRKKELQSF